MEKRHDSHQNHEDFYFVSKVYFIYFWVSEFKRGDRKSSKKNKKKRESLLSPFHQLK
jgi:hypothetical protein